MANGFTGRDLISIKDLNKHDIESILGLAERMTKRNWLDIAYDKLATLFFFESCTRTRMGDEFTRYGSN